MHHKFSNGNKETQNNYATLKEKRWKKKKKKERKKKKNRDYVKANLSHPVNFFFKHGLKIGRDEEKGLFKLNRRPS